MGCFHLKPPSRSSKIFSFHQGLKESSPRTTPLFPWARTLFKAPGASIPLPAPPQQGWSPAPHSHILPQSYQATCVLHTNPDLVCPWGVSKYWVLVLPSVPPRLPCSCLRQWDGSLSSRLHDLRDQWAFPLPPIPTIFGVLPILKEMIKYTASTLSHGRIPVRA